MKEDLIRQAVEMAKRCRKYHDEREQSLEGQMEAYTGFIQSAWEFIGFCRALTEVDIFSGEDVWAIWFSAFPEPEFSQGSEEVFPSQIMSFIQTLEDVDKLGPD